MADVISNTPYDDAFKTMYVECDELVYPLLNEVFGEHYSGNEKIIRRGNEFFENEEDGAENRLFSDSFIEVIGKETKIYHCECESTPNGNIIVRMFRYGAQMALQDAVQEGNKLNVLLPAAGIIFLRSNSETPDDFSINIKAPGDKSLQYIVPALKISSYSIDEIFEKRLYFLIPFYIFNLENKLQQYESDKNKITELKRIYAGIFERLEQDNISGNIKSFSFGLVKDMTNKVVQNVAQKYDNVRKGMGEIMGGHVLDSVVIRARDEGIQKGIEKGIEKGKTALADAIMKIHAGATVEDLIKEGVDEDTANLAWTCR